MNPIVPTIPAVALAYLIGAIPFGFLIARWARGIDIRTVGSGNIGATNVGRVLGLRFFVLVFALDMLKGFLPTYMFPRAVAAIAGRDLPEAGVLVALATILGHNFPVYLKFRGGKGVATSLGALLALDPVAGLSAAAGFGVFLLVTRYVSLSSLLGGLVFAAVYLSRTHHAWDRDHFAMSTLTLGLLGLLIVRHRENLARIGEGTEPKVSLRTRRKPPEGKVAWVLVVSLAALAAGTAWGLSVQASRRTELVLGDVRLTEVARVGTGHQRAERVTFADGGKLLAVTCPRYNQLVLYRVTGSETLELVRDIELGGQPVAACAGADRVYVLERPAGDARHVEPGWWEAFDFRGDPIGMRGRAGMYPDDMAVSPDGRHALVLTSGRAEGDPDKPSPALDVFDLETIPPRSVARIAFDRPGDDPSRLSLSASGRHAAVALLGSDQVAAIDWTDREHPRPIGRSPLPADGIGYPSFSADDWIMMPVAAERDAVLIPGPEPGRGFVAGTLPHGPGVLFYEATTLRRLGQLPLRSGALNLGVSRPTGLAFAPGRGLLAVAGRSGSVHLLALRRSAMFRSDLK